jgi:iron complex outermembrane recepter protein
MLWSRGVAGLCAFMTVQILIAQSAAAAPPESRTPQEVDANGDAAQAPTTLDEVIVTGTSRERRRFDAAFAVSTVSEQQMDVYAPLSSVDLFAKLPGFGAEPSGGETGNNINVRGLPSSNFRFVSVVEDGLPIFQEQQEPFLNADELVRLDLMTERVEAVRGGTSSIFESNAPGATINVITRVGSREPQGALRLTTGDFGLYRLDGEWSGLVANDLLVAVGGYIRRDDGPRPTGFTADRGGQFRVNVTRRFDNTELTVYAKRLDDRTAFYLPIPLSDPRNPSVSLSNLLNPLYGTLTSSDFRRVSIRTLDATPHGTTVNEDLADGVHPRINTVGASLEWQGPADWRVSDKMRYVEGTVKFNALFSLFPPQGADDFLASELERARAGFGPQVTSLEYVLANTRDPSGARIAFNPAATAGLVVTGGWWRVDNHISNFINDLRLSRSISGVFVGGHELSAGAYFSDYTLRQLRLFNTMLLEMRNNPRALDVLALDAAGHVVGSVTENGFLSYVDNTDLGGRVNGRLWALYVTDDWKLDDRLTLDAGIRHQQTRQHGYAMVRTTQNLGNPETLADDAVGGPTGALDHRSEQFSATAWTLGANYKISRDFGVFARYTSSFRTPNLSDIYTGATQVPAVVTKVKEAEFGAKLRGDGLELFTTVFWNRFDPTLESISVQDANGALVSIPFIGQTRAYGIELEGYWRPGRLFELSGNLTLQRPTFQNLAALATGQSVPGVDGNQVERLAEVLASVTPLVNLNVFGSPTQLYVTAYHQGRRFVDSANTTQLPEFTTLDAGVILSPSKRLRLQMVGTNLTNKLGLTEGNPRVDTLTGQGTSTAIYARPIFGRLFRASLTYSW